MAAHLAWTSPTIPVDVDPVILQVCRVALALERRVSRRLPLAHRYLVVTRAMQEGVSHAMQVHECLGVTLDPPRLAGNVIDWGGLTLNALDEQLPRCVRYKRGTSALRGMVAYHRTDNNNSAICRVCQECPVTRRAYGV